MGHVGEQVGLEGCVGRVEALAIEDLKQHFRDGRCEAPHNQQRGRTAKRAAVPRGVLVRGQGLKEAAEGAADSTTPLAAEMLKR